MTSAWSELLGVGIVPVVALENAQTAVPLADALAAGGIKVIEWITVVSVKIAVSAALGAQ